MTALLPEGIVTAVALVFCYMSSERMGTMKFKVKQSIGWSHQEYEHYSLGLAAQGAMESSSCDVALPNHSLGHGSSMLTTPQ